MSDNHPRYTEYGATRTVAPTMLKGLVFTALLLAGIAALGLAAFALRSPTGPKVAAEEPLPLPVEVMPVEYGAALTVEETFSGLAEARRTSALGFQSGGRIDSIAVRVGDSVRAGQTLARLDTRGLSAQLGAANAVLAEAEAAYQLALSTVERQKTLMAQGHVSQQRVDEAVAQADAARARINAASAQADTLRVQIDLARITAPFNGMITRRLADEGAIAAPGQTVLELVEAGALEATIGVPPSAVAGLKTGEIYTLASDVGPVAATLRSVTGVVDSRQRTVAAVFSLSPDAALPSGSLVRLRLPRDVGEDGFWVPLKALSSASRGMWTVYAAIPAEGGWRAEPRVVEIVYPAGDRAFVRGPFAKGDRIIIDGLQRITPGMAVMPSDAARALAAGGG